MTKIGDGKEFSVIIIQVFSHTIGTVFRGI